ncbi:MAG: TOBE domain-containing protein [Campylobacteraceae bacterium]|jgi:molybdopterin-binding protein|nr:TOBE domain-containing protein [Campylobacteraceae bacterium]
MSKIIASVVEIIGKKEVHIVRFDHFGQQLAMMSLELPSCLKTGDNVILSIKPSSIGIAKNHSGEFSFSNNLHVKIARLDIGDILCLAKLEMNSGFYIESLLTAESARRMNLNVNDEVSAFFKASELSLHKVCP